MSRHPFRIASVGALGARTFRAAGAFRATGALLATGFLLATGVARAEGSVSRDAMTLSDIEACASRNLPDRAGVIGFTVDAVDRTGTVTQSKAELRWRKPEAEAMRVMLVVSEPAKTAGTALLIVDRVADDPEFFVSLPEMNKVRKIRSKRMRGPVLGTDFSYEDLDRLRSPLSKAPLELIGSESLEGERAWILETIPESSDGSEYSRVLTFIDQQSCLPVRIDLFEPGLDGAPRLRKQLVASRAGIRPTAERSTSKLPHEFVMKDLHRETSTVVRIERFESSSDLPEEDFTRAALAAESKSAQPVAAPN